jgi:hypothetical protein
MVERLPYTHLTTLPVSARARARCVTLASVLVIGILGTGCAGAGSLALESANAWEPADHGRVTPRGDVILAAEIRASSVQTAYDAVLKLRPVFFVRDHSAGSGRAPVRPSVVLERGLPESLDVLRLVRADQVAEIVFIEPDDATVRFGSAFTAGVIIVRLTPSGL